MEVLDKKEGWTTVLLNPAQILHAVDQPFAAWPLMSRNSRYLLLLITHRTFFMWSYMNDVNVLRMKIATFTLR